MKLRELESLMQEVAPFERPKIALEQYPTGAHLASRLLYTAATSFDEIEHRYVIDLGCGTGMLGIGAAALGAGAVLGADVDADALAVARRNLSQFEGLDGVVDFVLCAAQHLPRALRGWRGQDGQEAPWGRGGEGPGDDPGAAGSRREKAPTAPLPPFDVAITNPPFGTRRKGADVAFLNVCFGAAAEAVYSLHKSSTRTFLGKLGDAHPRVAGNDVIAQMRYDLPRSYVFHKDATRDIDVDVWRYEIVQEERKNGARARGAGAGRGKEEEDTTSSEEEEEEDTTSSDEEEEEDTTSSDEEEEEESSSSETEEEEETSSSEEEEEETSSDEEEESGDDGGETSGNKAAERSGKSGKDAR